jgi:ATP-dependent RNA helicase RhlB
MNEETVEVPNIPVNSHRAEDVEEVRFADLDLPGAIQAGIDKAGFELCTPIQAKTLPITLGGKDVAGQAQTGTGKTAAFLISVFARLLANKRERKKGAPRALVIAPTRELAIQIAKDAVLLGGDTGFSIQVVYGGVDYRKQREELAEEVDLLIGTPGRLIDYYKQRVYTLDAIETVVVDEADRMFDMGFIKDLRFLLDGCPPPTERQSLLFSATLSYAVMELAFVFMNDAVKVEIEPDQVTAENVKHVLYHVGKEEKFPTLFGVLKSEGAERTLVFTNMRRMADDIVRTLELNGYRAEQITGDIDQRKRERILEEFRAGTVPILVATDVASRGLHIDNVTHVINFDLPLDAEDYVHRVGRTARAGASGTAISLACERYVEGLEAIEKYIGFKLPFDFPDESMLLDYKRAPRRPFRKKGPGGRSGDGRGRSGDSRARGGEARGRGGRSGERRTSGSSASAGEPAKAATDNTGGGEPGKKRRRRRRSGKPDGAAAAVAGKDD